MEGGQLAIGEQAAPAVTPPHRVDLAARMLAGMAVGDRFPSWERAPQAVRDAAAEQARRALDSIAAAAG